MKAYLLSVVTAAIISGIVTKLLGSKGTQGAVGRLIAGLFLTFTIISPLRNIRLASLSSITDSYTFAAQAAVEEGKNLTSNALSLRIKQGCEAYILDKAEQLDTQLDVAVTLDDGSIPSPVAVVLKGNASPNARKTLTQIIAEDLGIPKEAQKWT